ncbi:integrating conjugative element protein, PFL_4711 family [Serratia quinivorans]|uniref:Integrating conjugative element protein, PFL_4711 family n=1 Tax=Serratia quinivorans TaxID=137545 RepID=A0A379ZYB8_9GAMM|nr:integrating conjugative element protein, PFL_4711 family [Serratia quinivorans]
MLSLLVVSSLMLVGMNAHADDNDDNGTLFGISLPQVNDSNIGYGKSASGAVSDKLFYSLGGGSVISQPATRGNMQRLGMNLGWSSDLMCGNFDLKTTIGNQLNGVTDGFKNLMGSVIQGATGAVASLPAMAIQRANPGLYEMLTNGVLQGGVAFDKAQLNCQNLSKRMMDMADSGGWSQAAAMEEAKSLINNGGCRCGAVDECHGESNRAIRPDLDRRSKAGWRWPAGHQANARPGGRRLQHDECVAGHQYL